MNDVLEGPGSLPAGSRLGRYQIVRRIALGGMAELYLARQLGEAGYEKVVALKRVLPHLAEETSFVDMFLNEARLAAGLDHSGIAHVLDFGSEAGEHFMALEYVHGRDVQQILKAARGKVPLHVALTIAHEVAGALHYAHERRAPNGDPLGLVHRDISPSNVIVSFDGDVKLVDFGIAKATAHSQVTQTASIKGKLAYMSPEQLRGEALDRRCDVFSLSVMFYELVLGRRCFTAPGEFALINKVADARYPKPSRVDPNVPKPLEAILEQGLSAEPDDRPANARSLQLMIESFARETGERLSRVGLAEYLEGLFGVVDYPRTDGLPEPVELVAAEPVPTRSHSRRTTPWIWIGGALAVGLGLGVGVPLMLGDDPQPTDTLQTAPAPSSPARSSPATASAASKPSVAAPQPEERAAEPEEVIAIEDDEPAPARPRKRRRSKTKRKATARPSAEYLPPSRRAD